MEVFDLDSFRVAIKSIGFRKFWHEFSKTYIAEKRPDLASDKGSLVIDFKNRIFDFDNLGELYEIGLEADNQISKKELGQYYTPKDTSRFMAEKIVDLYDKNIDNLADVCCGTGNLILEVLSLLKDDAYEIIKNGRLYLYDLDQTAVEIAIMKISILFIKEGDSATYQYIKKLIHVRAGNFLDDAIILPDNCVLISNPPYGKIPEFIKVWGKSKTKNTNEMYAVFLEKMAIQCKNAVVISPQSFLGGEKFKTLRAILANYGGSVFSFDNIPCPIFVGRKKGIFNSNRINSVRAAITIIDKTKTGFRVSPMIRFKAEERKKMFLQLDNLLGNFTYASDAAWTKIPKTLEPLVKELRNAKNTIADLIEERVPQQNMSLKITIPSTPRYFITGSKRDLSRSSKIELYAKDKDSFDKIYIMVNSTFSYLWWRIYDGGITLSKQTLLTMPVPDLTAGKLVKLVQEGIAMEDKFLVSKTNAGKKNENIKFPEEYRYKVNTCVLSSIHYDGYEDKLYSVHSNSLLPILPAWT